MITAKVIADSSITHKGGCSDSTFRLTTMVVTFPRIILAEFNTHRMFSRNSASSRAIPFHKMLKSVMENPFIPMAFQKDHPGMQGKEYLSPNTKFRIGDDLFEILANVFKYKEGDKVDEEIIQLLQKVMKEYNDEKTLVEWWLLCRDKAVECATLMSCFYVTKQLCNRLLEPFMYHTVIVSATEFENFFALRCPQYGMFYEQIPMEHRSKKDFMRFANKVEAQQFQDAYANMTDYDWLQINKGQAEIHMMALAEAMWDAYNESTPEQLEPGEWHIPYKKEIEQQFDISGSGYIQANKIGIFGFDKEKFTRLSDELRVKISTVMAARTSYTVVGVDGVEWTLKKYVDKHNELVSANPLHASPLEHCGQAMTSDEALGIWDLEPSDLGGNFNGFKQYRKMFANENVI